jgi:hypothetical protein
MSAAKRLGRPRAAELRSELDAILYIALTGLPVADAAQGTFSGHFDVTGYYILTGREAPF